MRHFAFRTSRVARALVLPVLAATSLLAGPRPARADDEGRLKLFGHSYSVLAGATWTIPQEPTTRDIYGRGSINPSLTLWNFNTEPGFGLAWDLHRDRLKKDDSEALMFSGGVGPRFQFARASAAVAPSLAVRGDAVLVRLQPGEPWRWKPNVNAELSFSILRHLVLGGRYDYMPEVDGVDLSGFSVRALVKVF
jgi:hypothetical protein